MQLDPEVSEQSPIDLTDGEAHLTSVLAREHAVMCGSYRTEAGVIFQHVGTDDDARMP